MYTISKTPSESFVNHVMAELNVNMEPGNGKFKSALELTGKLIYKEHRVERWFRLESLEECAEFMHVSCGFKRSRAEVLEAIKTVRKKGFNGCDYEYMYLVKNI